MKLFQHRGRVRADVGDGFVAGEAVALQTAFLSALTGVERGSHAPVHVGLTLAAEHGGRVVVVCRNRTVGFVPPALEESLRAQAVAAGRARLVTPGQAYRVDGVWRVWVGPPPAHGMPADASATDTLPAPRRAMFGFALPDDGADDARGRA